MKYLFGEGREEDVSESVRDSKVGLVVFVVMIVVVGFKSFEPVGRVGSDAMVEEVVHFVIHEIANENTRSERVREREVGRDQEDEGSDGNSNQNGEGRRSNESGFVHWSEVVNTMHQKVDCVCPVAFSVDMIDISVEVVLQEGPYQAPH